MADRNVHPPSYAYSNLAANATTLLKTGQGLLHSIVINNAGASSNVCQVYDGLDAGGTLIATIDTVELNGRVLLYDVHFRTGLTIVMGTGTAADLTVAYQ